MMMMMMMMMMMVVAVVVVAGAVLAQKSSGMLALPHQPFHHRVHFIRSPKPKNTNSV